MAPDSQIEIHRAGEWSALYYEGQLAVVGDHYLSEEWIETHFGIKVVDDDAFLRGQSKADGVAPTLTELQAYAQERSERRARAELLRERAARMMSEAESLERGPSVATE